MALRSWMRAISIVLKHEMGLNYPRLRLLVAMNVFVSLNISGLGAERAMLEQES